MPETPSTEVGSTPPPRPWLERVLDWWLPNPCLGCGDPVGKAREALGLCPRCRHALPRWPASRCAGCGLTRGGQPRRTEAQRGGEVACRGCRGSSLDRVIATWRYESPLDGILLGLKFRRLDYLGPQLGRAMARHHRHELGDRDAVVPVPLHWSRRLSRGYNQAELLAREIAHQLALPMVGSLRRRRATPPQSRRSRSARRHNLDGAFVVRDPTSVAGQRLLLVDDVTTTGATLEAAAQALGAAGAENVVALVAARTPATRTATRGRRKRDG